MVDDHSRHSIGVDRNMERDGHPPPPSRSFSSSSTNDKDGHDPSASTLFWHTPTMTRSSSDNNNNNNNNNNSSSSNNNNNTLNVDHHSSSSHPRLHNHNSPLASSYGESIRTTLGSGALSAPPPGFDIQPARQNRENAVNLPPPQSQHSQHPRFNGSSTYADRDFNGDGSFGDLAAVLGEGLLTGSNATTTATSSFYSNEGQGQGQGHGHGHGHGQGRKKYHNEDDDRPLPFLSAYGNGRIDRFGQGGGNTNVNASPPGPSTIPSSYAGFLRSSLTHNSPKTFTGEGGVGSVSGSGSAGGGIGGNYNEIDNYRRQTRHSANRLLGTNVSGTSSAIISDYSNGNSASSSPSNLFSTLRHHSHHGDDKRRDMAKDNYYSNLVGLDLRPPTKKIDCEEKQNHGRKDERSRPSQSSFPRDLPSPPTPMSSPGHGDNTTTSTTTTTTTISDHHYLRNSDKAAPSSDHHGNNRNVPAPTTNTTIGQVSHPYKPIVLTSDRLLSLPSRRYDESASATGGGQAIVDDDGHALGGSSRLSRKVAAVGIGMTVEEPLEFENYAGLNYDHGGRNQTESDDTRLGGRGSRNEPRASSDLFDWFHQHQTKQNHDRKQRSYNNSAGTIGLSSPPKNRTTTTEGNGSSHTLNNHNNEVQVQGNLGSNVTLTSSLTTATLTAQQQKRREQQQQLLQWNSRPNGSSTSNLTESSSSLNRAMATGIGVQTYVGDGRRKDVISNGKHGHGHGGHGHRGHGNVLESNDYFNSGELASDPYNDGYDAPLSKSNHSDVLHHAMAGGSRFHMTATPNPLSASGPSSLPSQAPQERQQERLQQGLVGMLQTDPQRHRSENQPERRAAKNDDRQSGEGRMAQLSSLQQAQSRSHVQSRTGKQSSLLQALKDDNVHNVDVDVDVDVDLILNNSHGTHDATSNERRSGEAMTSYSLNEPRRKSSRSAEDVNMSMLPITRTATTSTILTDDKNSPSPMSTSDFVNPSDHGIATVTASTAMTTANTIATSTSATTTTAGTQTVPLDELDTVTRKELSPFLHPDKASRGLVLALPPLDGDDEGGKLQLSDVRALCERHGTVEAFRASMERRVVLVTYFDMRAAERASAHIHGSVFCVPLHASNAQDDATVLLEGLPIDTDEEGLKAALDRYGPTKSVQYVYSHARGGGKNSNYDNDYDDDQDDEDERPTYLVEYFDIQDANYVFMELVHSQSPEWSDVSVKRGKRVPSLRRKGKELLGLLAKWRTTTAAATVNSVVFVGNEGTKNNYHMSSSSIVSNVGTSATTLMTSNGTNVTRQTTRNPSVDDRPHNAPPVISVSVPSASRTSPPVNEQSSLQQQASRMTSSTSSTPPPPSQLQAHNSNSSAASSPYAYHATSNNQPKPPAPEHSQQATNGNAGAPPPPNATATATATTTTTHLVLSPDGQYSYVPVHHHHHHPPTQHSQPQHPPPQSHVDVHTATNYPSQLYATTSPGRPAYPHPSHGHHPHGAPYWATTTTTAPTTTTYGAPPAHYSSYPPPHMEGVPLYVMAQPPPHAHAHAQRNDSNKSHHHHSHHPHAPPGTTAIIYNPSNHNNHHNNNNNNNKHAQRIADTNWQPSPSPPQNTHNQNMQLNLNIAAVKNGTDTRTSLMVRNIPNKYNQKMLMTEFAEFGHAGTSKIDFFYLPIDFKNRCNRGYAFINFVDYRDIVPFYDRYNRQPWRAFNSEKICAITYARIQGKAAMLKRFEHSSLLDQNEEYRPLVFISHGPQKGQREEFPTSNPSYENEDNNDYNNNNNTHPTVVSASATVTHHLDPPSRDG